MDISYQFQKVGICINQNGFISPSKELTVHVMGPVETLSINAIDVPHAPGQVGIRGLSQEMIMIA